MADPKLQGLLVEAGKLGHYEPPETRGLGMELDFQLFPELQNIIININPVPPAKFSRGRTSTFSTHTAFKFTRGAASLLTTKGPPTLDGIQVEAAKLGHYEAPATSGLGVELDFQLFPELYKIEFNVNPVWPDIFTRGDESEFAFFIPALIGMEVSIAPFEDIQHPYWDGTEGISSVTVNADGSVELNMGSTITDINCLPLYMVYIKEGVVSAADLFEDANKLGAFTNDVIRVLKDASGSYLASSTQYTVGVRLIDSRRNLEMRYDTTVFINAASSITLMDAPGIRMVDDGTGTSATLTLTSIPTDPDYDHVAVYRLRGMGVVNPGYKELSGTMTNVGDTIHLTGLAIGEDIKLVAVCVDTIGAFGTPSRVL